MGSGYQRPVQLNLIKTSFGAGCSTGMSSRIEMWNDSPGETTWAARWVWGIIAIFCLSFIAHSVGELCCVTEMFLVLCLIMVVMIYAFDTCCRWEINVPISFAVVHG